MKSRIIALALIVLFLVPLTTAPINGQYLIPDPVRTNQGAYEDDFSDVSTWIVEGDGGGTVDSDGEQATFSMPAVNFEDNFYRTIPTENLYLTFYEFNVTAFYNLNAEFRIYQSGTYHQICSISAIGLYNGTIYTELSAASRISFLLEPIPEDSGNMTIDYLNIVPLWSAAPFSETLDDDVLHYPDSFLYESEVLAYEGSAGYTDTHVKDSVDFTTGPWNDLNFTISNYKPIEYFSYQFYVSSSTSSLVDLVALNWVTDTQVIIANDVGAVGWHNSTYMNDEYFSSTGKIRLKVFTGMDTADIDYFSVNYYVVTHNSSYHYVESFANVSEWQLEFESSGLPSRSFTSDGDILTFEIGFDDAGNEVARYNVTLSGLSVTDYIEYRFISSTTAGSYKSAALSVWLDDVEVSRDYSSTWDTKKFYVDDIIDVAPTTLAIQVDDYSNTHASDTGYIKLDYIRIGPSDEMGWQHDGSTTEGFIAQNEYCVLSTDGDLLNFSADGSVAYWDFLFDTTTTLSYIDPDHYPFSEFRIDDMYDANEDDNVWTLRYYYDGGNYYSIIDDDTVGIHYENLVAGEGGSNDRYKMRIWCNADEWFTLDYIKMNGIADYTISQSSTTVDDYLYVSEGVLYSDMDNGTITLDYDPTDLDFVGVHTWNKSTSFGTSELSFYLGSWSSYYNTTQGDLMGGNLTDIRIRFSEDTNIINIFLYKTPPQWHSFTFESIYFDLPNWHGFTFEDIIFYIPINVLTLSYIMMLAGLVMIPVSTLFLVKGGRSDMSRDKMFLFLMIFLFGWAFFLGGIL